MKQIIIAIIMALVMTWAAPSFCGEAAPEIVVTAGKKAAEDFDRLDAGLRQAAKALSATGLTGQEARKALAKLCADFDYAVDCAAVDLKGIMVTVEPKAYREYEGSDISGQEQVARIVKTGKPVMSSVFRAVEGFPAVDAEYPILDSKGRRIGAVSILFHPGLFLKKTLEPVLRGTPVNIWAMEKGGYIIYDIDASQIGLNLFSSSLYQPYPGLVELGRRIVVNREGTGDYTFLSSSSGQTVSKKAFWLTTGLYGTEWRLVAIHEQRGSSKPQTGIAVAGEPAKKKLGALAAEGSLIRALAAGDQQAGMKLFEEFYKETPGIYSVQWTDAQGINRFGYPRENSLTGYDYKELRRATDREMLDILAAKKPASVSMPLLEGRRGTLDFRPVFDGGRYLGMIYIIRLNP